MRGWELKSPRGQLCPIESCSSRARTYHATEDGFIEIWPAGLAFAAEVNRAGRDAWLEMDEIAIAVFRAKAPH